MYGAFMFFCQSLMIVTDKEQSSALVYYLLYWRLKINVSINNKDDFVWWFLFSR